MSLFKGRWSHIRDVLGSTVNYFANVNRAISCSVDRDASSYIPLIILSLSLCPAVTARWARRAVDVGKSLLDLAASIIT